MKTEHKYIFRHVINNPELEAKLADKREKASRQSVFAAQAIASAAARRERLRARRQGAYGLD